MCREITNRIVRLVDYMVISIFALVAVVNAAIGVEFCCTFVWCMARDGML